MPCARGRRLAPEPALAVSPRTDDAIDLFCVSAVFLSHINSDLDAFYGRLRKAPRQYTTRRPRDAHEPDQQLISTIPSANYALLPSTGRATSADEIAALRYVADEYWRHSYETQRGAFPWREPRETDPLTTDELRAQRDAFLSSEGLDDVPGVSLIDRYVAYRAITRALVDS